MPQPDPIRTVAAILGWSEREVRNSRGGVTNWPELVIGYALYNRPIPRPRDLPVRVLQRLQELSGGGVAATGNDWEQSPIAPRVRIKTRVQRVPNRPDEENELGEFVPTPNSTNVFGFQYYRRAGEKLGMLYVTFRAHAVSNTQRGQELRGKNWTHEQSFGESGRTVGGKISKKGGARGATYWYASVPQSVYRQFLSVKDYGDKHGGFQSPGTGVWNALRQRGTIHGHKYRYGLFQGQLNPDGSVYIARKATSKGYKTRALRDGGTGAGGFRTSTLPEQNGFSTRRRQR